MSLQIGDKAPDFTLQSDDEKKISLSDFFGKKVILYFYPKDNTPGCTRQACDFRDMTQDFSSKNAVILGISKDTALKHQKFKQKYQLPFILLADTEGDVCEMYGIIDKKKMFGRTFLGIQRSTFLIDEAGVIRQIWRKVKVTGHIEKVLNEIS